MQQLGKNRQSWSSISHVWSRQPHGRHSSLFLSVYMATKQCSSSRNLACGSVSALLFFLPPSLSASLTLGVHAQRGLQYLSLCVSVKSHLTYGALVHPEKAVMYSAGNEGQNICLKQLCSRVMLQNTSEKANMLIF